MRSNGQAFQISYYLIVRDVSTPLDMTKSAKKTYPRDNFARCLIAWRCKRRDTMATANTKR
jgi:hypothetical protein